MFDPQASALKLLAFQAKPKPVPNQSSSSLGQCGLTFSKVCLLPIYTNKGQAHLSCVESPGKRAVFPHLTLAND